MSFFHNENRQVSSNQFANGSDQNCGNVITDRPTTRLHAPPGGKSSISFGGDDDSWAPTSTSSRGGSRPASNAKAREYVGNDIFGTGPPQDQHAAAAAPVAHSYEPAAPSAPQLAGEAQIKSMMLPELRTMCREHGLSPAGAKNTLVERIMEALSSGQVQIYAKVEKMSGVGNLTNNYARSEGQNVGNFLTDRTSSRVLRAPGGGSSISFGNDDSQPRPGTATSRAKMAEMQGHNVFSDQREPDHNQDRYVVSDAKLRNDLQGHQIFNDGSNYLGDAKGISDAKLKADLQGNNIFSDGDFAPRHATATSSAKMAEMSGQDVFSDGDQRLYNEAISAARSMKLDADQRGHNIFSNDTSAPNKRVTGGVHKPPGGGSSIVF